MQDKVNELEQDTLATLMLSWHLNRRGFEDALNILKPEDFARPLHQLVFRAIKQLHEARVEVAPQNITDWFEIYVEHGKELLRRKEKGSYLAEVLTYSESSADDVVTLSRRLKQAVLCLKALSNILSNRDPTWELSALAIRKKEVYRGIEDH